MFKLHTKNPHKIILKHSVFSGLSFFEEFAADNVISNHDIRNKIFSAFLKLWYKNTNKVLMDWAKSQECTGTCDCKNASEVPLEICFNKIKNITMADAPKNDIPMEFVIKIFHWLDPLIEKIHFDVNKVCRSNFYSRSNYRKIAMLDVVQYHLQSMLISIEKFANEEYKELTKELTNLEISRLKDKYAK